ncbi:MAG: hypothetical protein GX567_18505 [Clostridia bacterium]|nr:hypothetical protein [Clostridia bacterium]
MDWRDMLLPGDWVILSNDQEAVIVGKRDDSYWVEITGIEGEQRFQMIQSQFVKSISKNLEHWFLAV